MHVCDTWNFSAISRVVLWRSESIIALIRSSSTSTEIYQLLSCQPNIYKRRMKYRNIKKKKVGKIFQRFKTIETRVDYVVSFPGVFTRGVHFSKVSLFPWGAFHQSVTLGDNGTTIECVESVGRMDTHWKRSRTCNLLGASFWRRRKKKKKERKLSNNGGGWSPLKDVFPPLKISTRFEDASVLFFVLSPKGWRRYSANVSIHE